MLVRALILSLTLCISLSATSGQTPTPKGLEYCTVCHGSQLKGNQNIGAPRLSGLPQWYLERQLKNFKEGIRGVHSEDTRGMEMRMMVGTLREEDIKSIAAWVVATDSEQPEPTISADTVAGEALYQSCTACHGLNGQGNEDIGAPNLRGLNDWYLVTQINHFRLNLRGTESADVYGQQMRAASTIVASQLDAENLAAYISSLQTESE